MQSLERGIVLVSIPSTVSVHIRVVMILRDVPPKQDKGLAWACAPGRSGDLTVRSSVDETSHRLAHLSLNSRTSPLPSFDTASWDGQLANVVAHA